MINKLAKYIGALLLTTCAAGSIYYLSTLYKARQYTLAVIVPDLKNSQWRSLDGPARKFEILGHDLTKRQKEILIKVQDPCFYNHNGIDLATPGAGLTTITQAIVKKLYFHDFKSGIAKIKQSLIARFVVDDLISKEDQITIFLNAMYLGRVNGQPVIGLESAAAAYYRRPARQLTDDQYISLIAMLVMPGTFHLIDHPKWNQDRANRIKALMAGEYEPKGLMDQFYGDLPREIVKAGLPAASYFGKAHTHDSIGLNQPKGSDATD